MTKELIIVIEDDQQVDYEMDQQIQINKVENGQIFNEDGTLNITVKENGTNINTRVVQNYKSCEAFPVRGKENVLYVDLQDNKLYYWANGKYQASSSTNIEEVEGIVQPIKDDVEELTKQVENKVDKAEGKGLSTNDFTDEYKNQLDNLDAESNVQSDWNETDPTNDAYVKNKPTKLSQFTNDLNLPDDNTTYTFEGGTNSFKVTPKGGSVQTVSVTPSVPNATTSASGLMSAEDKTKLSGIQTGSTKVEKSNTNGNVKINGVETNVYTLPNNVVQDNGYVHTDNNYTTDEKNKLSGIEDNAQANVQSDWAATSGDSYIKNKPTKLSNFENDLNYIEKTEKGVANGVATLDENSKVVLSQLPDFLLGQVLFGGTIGEGNIATLSTNAKKKLGLEEDTLYITNFPTGKGGWIANEGIYYISTAVLNFNLLHLEIGDWLISTGSGWVVVKNTDAVTSVAGKYGDVKLDLWDIKNGDGTTLFDVLSWKQNRVEGYNLVADSEIKKLATVEANANYYVLPNDVVKDSNYVHTDNNYTTDEKTKLSKIQDEATKVESSTTNGNIKINDTETNVYTLPNDVVQDSAYVHTDNNYTTSEKDKLTSVQEGATKVEDSSNNGNILINGTETNVYTLPTDVVQDSEYVHTDNNYTTDEKNKLSGIETSATKVEKSDVNGNIKISGNEVNVYTLPSDVPHDSNYVHTDNNYTTPEKDKLAEIEERATRVLVDDKMSDTSTNPVQNKVIVEELKNYLGVIDCEELPPLKITDTNGNVINNPDLDTKKLYRIPDVKDYSIGTTVPNTGTVEKVYLNTNLSVDEVKEIINSVPKTDWVDSVWGVGKDLYIVRNIDGGYTNAVYIADNGSGQLLIFAPNLVWANVGLTEESTYYPAGWREFTNPIEINMEVGSEINGEPSGAYNDKLSRLFSITEYSNTYSDLGYKYYKYNNQRFELFGAVTNNSSGGSSGTIDDTSLAKLTEDNVFVGKNIFNDYVQFENSIKVNGVIKLSNGNGENGQVLTSTAVGTEWKTIDTSLYPSIGIGRLTFNATSNTSSYTGSTTEQQYYKIVNKGGVIVSFSFQKNDTSYSMEALLLKTKYSFGDGVSLSGIVYDPSSMGDVLTLTLRIDYSTFEYTLNCRSEIFYSRDDKEKISDLNKPSYINGLKSPNDSTRMVKYNDKFYAPTSLINDNNDSSYANIDVEKNKIHQLDVDWSATNNKVLKEKSISIQDVLELQALPTTNPKVPNTGTGTNIYFNTNLSYEEILKITDNLSWIDGSVLGLTGVHFYIIAGFNMTSSDPTDISGIFLLCIVKREDGLFISFIPAATFEPLSTIYESIEDKWYYYNDDISTLNYELLSEFMGMPVGAENDKLINLVSTINNFTTENDKLYRIPNYLVSQTLPNTGSIERIYFNKNITSEEFLEIMNSLTWIDASVVGDSGYSFNIVMGYLIGEVPYALFLHKSDEGYINSSIINYATNEEVVHFFEYTPYNKTIVWDSFSNPYTISKDVISDFMGLPIGAENDKLKSLISINSYKPISYDYYEIKDGQMKSFNKWEMAENGTFVAGTITYPHYLQIPIKDEEELELYIDTGVKDEDNPSFDGIYIGISGYFTFTFAPEQSVKVQIKKISNKYFITISGHMKHTSDNYRYVNKSFVMSDFDGKISIDGFSSGKEVNWYCLKK